MHKVQNIAITFDDGGVGIMQFILDPVLPEGTELPGLSKDGREATDEAIQHEVDKSLFPDRKVVSWRRIDAEHIPTDRSYRNAWKDDGKKIDHDMVKARNLHRDILRQERIKAFAELDVEYTKADEEGNQTKKKEISAQRQRLRDITTDPRIETAKSVTQLKQIGIK